SPQDTAVQVVKGNRRTIGGIRSVKGRDPFEMVNFTFDRGTMLYLTTDGLIDQHGHDRKRFGSPLLYETIMQMKNFSVVEQEQILLERLRVHQGEESQRDDITFMGIRL
ncbi:MAG: hypothetical protein RIS47_1544, partial [Bacteroidota bacterium]